MKDLSSVLHLYIGCPFVYGDGDFVREGWDGLKRSDNPTEYPLSLIWGKHFFDVVRVKLVLSRLSDMTEEDMKELYKIVFRREFLGDNITRRDKGKRDERIVLWSGVERLFIYLGGDIGADCDLHYFPVNQPMVFKWLLSKGYWLFDQSAFDNGLIIDNKTL